MKLNTLKTTQAKHDKATADLNANITTLKGKIKALNNQLIDADDKLTALDNKNTELRELFFLKDFEIEPIDPAEMEIGMGLPPLPDNEERVKRTEGLKELIDDILDRHADLKEFEDELKKHKDKITPGQVGES